MNVDVCFILRNTIPYLYFSWSQYKTLHDFNQLYACKYPSLLRYLQPQNQ